MPEILNIACDLIYEIRKFNDVNLNENILK